MRNLLDGVKLALGRALMIREELRSEDGQGAVEYALVVLGIAAIMVVAVAGFSGEITAFMDRAGNRLQTIVLP